MDEIVEAEDWVPSVAGPDGACETSGFLWLL